MKLTKSKLQQLIKEELQLILEEAPPTFNQEEQINNIKSKGLRYRKLRYKAADLLGK